VHFTATLCSLVLGYGRLELVRTPADHTALVMDAFDITNVKSLNNGFVFVWCAQRMQGDYASEVARAKAERVKMLQGFDNRNATEAKAAAQAAIKSVAAQVELVSSLSTSHLSWEAFRALCSPPMLSNAPHLIPTLNGNTVRTTVRSERKLDRCLTL
jgi:hypothetical protein